MRSNWLYFAIRSLRLDVYKRQLPNVEITKEVKPMMTIGERIEVKEFIPTKANDIPVSYTHLDVYKRQVLLIMCKLNISFFPFGS